MSGGLAGLEEADRVGRAFNFAGVGVDVHALFCEGGDGGAGLEEAFPLAVRSGGSCGVTDVRGYGGEAFSHMDAEKAMRGTPGGLVREVEAASAWADLDGLPRAYGAGLRIRTTRTFGVSRPASRRSSAAAYCSSGGMVGPVSSVPGDKDLWTFGCVDANGTVGFDLELKPGVTAGLGVEGYGGNGMPEEEILPPAMQVSFAYTGEVNSFSFLVASTVLTP